MQNGFQPLFYLVLNETLAIRTLQLTFLGLANIIPKRHSYTSLRMLKVNNDKVSPCMK